MNHNQIISLFKIYLFLSINFKVSSLKINKKTKILNLAIVNPFKILSISRKL